TQSSTDIAYPEVTDLVCGQPRQYREPQPAALRYWNIARQRHYHSSARCCAALRVSADVATRHGPQAGGKSGLFQERRRNPERDGLSAGGRWIRTCSTALRGRWWACPWKSRKRRVRQIQEGYGARPPPDDKCKMPNNVRRVPT